MLKRLSVVEHCNLYLQQLIISMCLPALPIFLLELTCSQQGRKEGHVHGAVPGVSTALQAAASEPTEVLSHSSSLLWVCLEKRRFPIFPDSIGSLRLRWVFLSHSQKEGRFDIKIREGWRIINCVQASMGHTGSEECPLDCVAS